MNKRAFRKKVVERLFENTWRVVVYQKRPNTFVRVFTKFGSAEYKGMGFSKVCIPDEWDAPYGIGLAKKKAIADISREIVNGEGHGDAMTIVLNK